MYYKTNRQTLKTTDTRDVYNAIDKYNIRRLRITFCSLTLNNECINSRTEVGLIDLAVL